MASAIKDKLTSAAASVTSSDPEKANTDSSGNDKRDNYRLRITAGPTYDKSLQRLLHVNSTQAHPVSDHCAVSVRIRDYTGLPSSAPVNVPEYFDLPAHAKDTFSVAWAFSPPRDIAASDLIFGIDTGHNPLKKFGLPKSLVNTAFKIVKEFVDPSLSCDAGVDEPWVRGHAMAGATTTFCVGDRRTTGDGSTQQQPPPNPEHGIAADQQAPPPHTQTAAGRDPNLSPPPQGQPQSQSSTPRGSVSSPRASSSGSRPDLSDLTFPDPALLVEGAVNPAAAATRDEAGLPSDAGKRRKHFLSDSKRAAYKLEQGRTYYFDFSNGHIDWKAYALKLPGFSVPVLKWIGGGKKPSLPEDGHGGEHPVGEHEQSDPERQGSLASQASAMGETSEKGKSGSHKVRFFLKDVKTDEVFFVIMCTLLTGDDLTAALEEDRREQQGQVSR